MIVADTNLISYLVLEGSRTKAARRAWQRDPRWVVPTLWRSEFLNVLCLSVRAGLIAEDDAFRTWEVASERLGLVERVVRRGLAVAKGDRSCCFKSSMLTKMVL